MSIFICLTEATVLYIVIFQGAPIGSFKRLRQAPTCVFLRRYWSRARRVPLLVRLRALFLSHLLFLKQELTLLQFLYIILTRSRSNIFVTGGARGAAIGAPAAAATLAAAVIRPLLPPRPLLLRRQLSLPQR